METEVKIKPTERALYSGERKTKDASREGANQNPLIRLLHLRHVKKVKKFAWRVEKYGLESI
jgi:hypothetical protein